ncbi:MAG: HNH endonuclease [Cyanobacteria bacterium J06639_16]
MRIQLSNPEPSIFRHWVVVFSKNYLPLTRISLKRAIALLVTDRAESLELGATQCWEVRSPNRILQVSEHIRLTGNHGERQWKVPPVSRREVFRRDQHQCQYCSSKKRLTIDHVIPRSKGHSHLGQRRDGLRSLQFIKRRSLAPDAQFNAYDQTQGPDASRHGLC